MTKMRHGKRWEMSLGGIVDHRLWPQRNRVCELKMMTGLGWIWILDYNVQIML